MRFYLMKNSKNLKKLAKTHTKYIFPEKEPISFLGYWNFQLYIFRKELQIVNTITTEITVVNLLFTSPIDPNYFFYSHSNEEMIFINNYDVFYFNARDFNQKKQLLLDSRIVGLFSSFRVFFLITESYIVEYNHNSLLINRKNNISKIKYGVGYYNNFQIYLLLLIGKKIKILNTSTWMIETIINPRFYPDSFPIIIWNHALYYHCYHSVIQMKIGEFNPIRIEFQDGNQKIPIRAISYENGSFFVFSDKMGVQKVDTDLSLASYDIWYKHFGYLAIEEEEQLIVVGNYNVAFIRNSINH